MEYCNCTHKTVKRPWASLFSLYTDVLRLFSVPCVSSWSLNLKELGDDSWEHFPHRSAQSLPYSAVTVNSTQPTIPWTESNDWTPASFGSYVCLWGIVVPIDWHGMAEPTVAGLIPRQVPLGCMRKLVKCEPVSAPSRSTPPWFLLFFPWLEIHGWRSCSIFSLDILPWLLHVWDELTHFFPIRSWHLSQQQSQCQTNKKSRCVGF